MTIYRLSGGVGPIDGDDPRTFTGIWNDMANQVEESFDELDNINQRITDLGLEELEGVQIDNPQLGQVFQYNGVEWTNAGRAEAETFNAYYVVNPYAYSTYTLADLPGISSNWVKIHVVGAGGGGGGGQGDSATPGGTGTNGGQTTVTGTGLSIIVPGGAGGPGGGTGLTPANTLSALTMSNGGAGGQCSNSPNARSMGTDGRGGGYSFAYVDRTQTPTINLTVGAEGIGGAGSDGATGGAGGSSVVWIEYGRTFS